MDANVCYKIQTKLYHPCLHSMTLYFKIKIMILMYLYYYLPTHTHCIFGCFAHSNINGKCFASSSWLLNQNTYTNHRCHSWSSAGGGLNSLSPQTRINLGFTSPQQKNLGPTNGTRQRLCSCSSQTDLEEELSSLKIVPTLGR